MGDLLDTILNVIVFVFIGLMIWLYLKKTPANDRSENTAKGEGD
jgi:hypothetical protein